MKTEVNHRSSNDLKWQETKKLVKARDHNECRFLTVLTPYEMAQVEKCCTNKSMLKPTDCAHMKPVGNNFNLTYDLDNIYFLCRYAHNCIDNLINPLTLEHMTRNEQWYWWWRIKYCKTMKYMSDLDYGDMMSNKPPAATKKSIMEWW